MEGRRCLSMAWAFRDRNNKPLSWNAVFESPLQQKVNKWVSSLKELQDLKIKRYLFDSEPKTTEPYEARQKEMFIEGFGDGGGTKIRVGRLIQLGSAFDSNAKMVETLRCFVLNW